MRRKAHWWDDAMLTAGDFTDAQLDAELARAQQVGEDAAAEMIAFYTDRLPCPICGRAVGDHTRRELRRCDHSRPDLRLVS